MLSHDGLSDDEKEIINSFLEYEFASNAYKFRKNDNIIVIEKSISKSKVVDDYLSVTKDYKESYMDSSQIRRIKKVVEKDTLYNWKLADFKNDKLQIQSFENFRKTLKNEEYLHLPKRLIFHLSVPILIDDENALISFMAGSGDSGFTSINSGIVLMTKNNKNEWVFKRFLGSIYS